MAHDPHIYAEALYVATRDKDGKDAEDAVLRFVRLMEKRGLTSLLYLDRRIIPLTGGKAGGKPNCPRPGNSAERAATALPRRY